MSTRLHWRTTITAIEDSHDDEPWKLREIFETMPQFRERTKEGTFKLILLDIPYLYGLRDAGLYGVREIIEVLERHTEIEIFFK